MAACSDANCSFQNSSGTVSVLRPGGVKSTSEILISVLTCTVRHFSEVAAALAEFERELISEQTKAGLESARACGPKSGGPFKITPATVRLAMAPMGQPETNVAALGRKPGITRHTLYRQVFPTGELREHGRKTARWGT